MVDRIALVRSSFTAFTSIGKGFGPRLREEIRGVAVSIYAGKYPVFSLRFTKLNAITSDLLKNEKSEIDLTSPTLQSLKGILEHPPNQGDALVHFGKLVHGLLSSCLVNVDEMRYVKLCYVKYVDCNDLLTIEAAMDWERQRKS